MKTPAVGPGDSDTVCNRGCSAVMSIYQTDASSIPDKYPTASRMVGFFNRTLRVVQTGYVTWANTLFVKHARLAYRHQAKWGLLPDRSRGAAHRKMFLIQIESETRGRQEGSSRSQPLFNDNYNQTRRTE